MYDAIVVGARCAGASTAMLLARRGHRVLLLDRATFPSDIPHGHYVYRHGPRRLRDWGLLDRVAATGCPAVTELTSDFGDFPLRGTGLAADGVPMAYAPRRSVLDALLVEAAVEAGVELRQGVVVEGFTSEGARITGIRARTRDGTSFAERARVTVGADGRNSRLARTVEAPAYEAHPPVSCWYWSYWSGAPQPGLGLYLRPGFVILAFPTNDGLTAAFVAFPRARLEEVRADVEGAVTAALDRIPDLGERIRGGRREERYYGATDLPNFLRRPHGPGWALVGDAGCHKDPLMALGICDALRDADLLAAALHEGLSGQAPLDAALAGYERRRNEATLDLYRQNLARAQFRPLPPELLQMRAALRGDTEATRRVMLVDHGLRPARAEEDGHPPGAAIPAR